MPLSLPSRRRLVLLLAMIVPAGVAGDVQASFDQIGLVRAQADAGKLRMLAVSGLKRWQELPNLPTLDESGFKGFNISFSMGFSTTKGTPRAIVDRLSQALLSILASADARERLTAQHFELVPCGPGEFARYIEAEFALWAKVVKASGARVD